MISLAAQATRLADYFASGGLVMWPLVGLSIWAWTLVLLKGRQLASWRRSELSSEKVIQNILMQMTSSTEEPTAANTTANNVPCGWQASLAREFLRRSTGDPTLDERLLHRLAHRYQDKADTHVSTILIVAAAAPLLGLLGTVTGMINAFDALAAFGSGNPRALSGGISEALVSTQTGLLVAIPVLFAGQFLRRRAQTFKARVERFCAVLARAARPIHAANSTTARMPERMSEDA